MANKMLIDATHPEETRVVVTRGNRVEDFDFEAANRRQLRGNIYLAKVTRVEPSLQAAFVDYGGNRHGFLAFSEIHPDYYQIPVADRQALIEAEAAEAEAAEAADRAARARRAAKRAAETKVRDEAPLAGDAAPEAESAAPEGFAEDGDPDAAPYESGTVEEIARETREVETVGGDIPALGDSESSDEDAEPAPAAEEQVESVGAEDALEEVPERRRGRPRQYKIQEVIKRRQVLLVQVVKEERGTKGAALTTYLSLAGRYSVLMPNTARGGGISRKITNASDRKRLKDVAGELEVPEGMGVILRTAGASRTKAEVKRDFEYLLRLWESVREYTLASTAPTLVYEEGSLIKRSIRDLYSKDIDEILVAGEEGYREAKDFMRMLMPSHAKNVQPYRENLPIFARNGVEAQLDAMFSPQVTLKSGGYIVLNQTEALVSIDVNSGRSTREHNIEDTALQTNLEASDEIARQLRLRDLAGLVVIDYIDMEEKRNNRSVERRLKEALRNDRARIQVGHISHFGLLEMSRQRIRAGVLESTMEVCPICHGVGRVRSPSSVALHVLRSLEDQLLKGVTHNLTIRTRTPVALYILNQKRAHLSELERRFGLEITVLADEGVSSSSHYALERGEPVTARPVAPVQPTTVHPDPADEDDAFVDAADEIDVEAEADDEPGMRGEAEAEGDAADGEGNGGRRRRRRRRRRGDGNGHAEHANGGAVDRPVSVEAEADAETATAAEDLDVDDGDDVVAQSAAAASTDGNGESRRRRRGRRGGRRGRREDRDLAPAAVEAAPVEAVPADDADDAVARSYEIAEALTAGPAVALEAPPDFAVAPEPALELPAPEETAPEGAALEETALEEAALEGQPSLPEAETVAVEEVALPPPPPPEDNRPKRGGWWQRRGFF